MPASSSRSFARLPRPTLLASAICAVLGLASPVQAELPVPCAPCNVGAQSFNWRAAGSTSEYIVNGPQAIVRQALQNETFNWSQFNIGAGQRVEFQQPSSRAVALNRIFQADPSRIQGALRANGQVYLINQNGIVFGPGAQVDVNTLLASSIEPNAEIANLFEQLGITNAVQQQRKPPFKNGDGDVPGSVEVADGARITATPNGRVILIGGEVRNAGTIETSGPGGQVILAAARDEVFLFFPQDPDLRGLGVELGDGGTVENLGRIVARQGNVTLAGLTVNQRGLVRATSAVDVNGSIRLQARDGATTITEVVGVQTPLPSRAGTVTLGAGSVTEVVPDPDDRGTAIDDQVTRPSTVRIDAETVAIGGTLRATGGTINVQADNDPSPADVRTRGRITVDAGAVIDASGVEQISVPMSRNVATVEVRGNELAGSPVQRGGVLFGEKVSFDVRKPLPRIANLEAGVLNVARSGPERMAAGGTITLRAFEAVDVAAGATLDVSGGAVNYEAGFLNTTRLLFQGRLIDIADADPLVRYDGVLGELEFEHRKWGAQTTQRFSPFGAGMRGALTRFEPGYVEGKDAGRFDIEGLTTSIAGALLADSTSGINQFLPPGDAAGFLRPFQEQPRGGTLKLTALNQDLVVTGDTLPFVSRGLQHFELGIARFDVKPGANVDLGAGGSLRVTAGGEARIDGRLRAQSGTLYVSSGLAAGDGNGRLVLGAGALLDASGGWVNDELPNAGAPLRLAPRFVDGGNVSLRSNGALLLDAGSVIDVTAGAAADALGRITPGDGGSVLLSAAVDRLIVAGPPEVRLAANFRAHTFPGAAVSSLDVSVPEVSIGAGAGALGTYDVPLSLFTEAGFGAIRLFANERGLRVGGTVDLAFAAHNLVRVPNVRGGTLPRTGTPLADFTRSELLAPALRQSTTLRFGAAPFLPDQRLVDDNADLLRIDPGAVLGVTPGGRIELVSTTPLRIAGELLAPGGSIAATLGTVGELGYDAQRAIWIEAGAVLDVAATALPFLPDDAGRVTQFARFAGGSIELTANEGYVMGLAGSHLDVSGATTTIDVPVRKGRVTRFERLPLALDAGTLDLRSSNGGALLSTLDGRANTALGAEGGSFRYTIDGGLRRNNVALVGAGANPFPQSPVRIELREGATGFGIAAPAAVADGFMGIARFDLAQVESGGFAAVELAARPSFAQRAPGVTPDPVMEARIDLIGDLEFAIDGLLAFDAPILRSDGGAAQLSARHFSLGLRIEDFVTTDTPLPGQAEPDVKWFTPAGGSGRLEVAAGFVELVGFTSLRGFGGAPIGDKTAVTLRSTGDLRLRGVRAPSVLSRRLDGVLTTVADLTLEAQRVYPTTLTDFRLLNEAPGGLVRIRGGSAAPAVPRSAGGALRVVADRIEQLGVVMAPLGSLDFDAGTNLLLGPNSLTSVTSAGQLQLFGQTQIGEWVLPFNNVDRHTRVFSAKPVAGVSELPPEKRIRLVADGLSGVTPVGSMTLAPGARLDVRSGGDLLATEFLPGPLGAIDLLDSGLRNGSFALLPADGAAIAAFDPLDTPSFQYAAGTRLTIDNPSISGLPRGSYDVLPPRYAVLPGAYLLTPTPATDGGLANVDLPLTTVDGRPVVTGTLQRFASGAPALVESRFIVEDAAALARRAEYRLTGANDFFTLDAASKLVPTPSLPGDAGLLGISANAALRLGATIAPDTGRGRGSLVDISADNITIRNGLTGATNTVELDANALRALGADSLLIGGARTLAGDLTTIERIDASEITLTAGTTLEGSELILVARDRLEIGDGAVVRASAAPRRAARRTLALDGDNALVMATRDALPTLRRANVGATPDAALRIDAGASLFGAGSLVIDSTGSSTLDGTLATGPAGGLRIGAARISLGVLGGGEPGLGLDAPRLQQLGVEELVISGGAPIDVFGSFALDLASLVIDAPGLVGRSAGAEVTLRAGTMRLENALGRAHTESGAAGTRLTLQGRADGTALALELGAAAGVDGASDGGDFDVVGFGAVTIDASSVVGVADHVLDLDAADVDVTAAYFAARSGVRSTLGASGALRTFAGAPGAIPADLTAFVGGGFGLKGASLFHASTVLAPSGVVNLVSRAGDLTIAGHVDAAGRNALPFQLTTLGTPGGTVTLQANGGDLTLLDGSLVDVSGGTGAKSGSGGRLQLLAGQGALDLVGSAIVRGGAAADVDGAQIDIDAGRLTGGLSAIAARLGGQFTAAKTVRVRDVGENLVLAGGDTMAARLLRLSADRGDVVLRGTLDARGTTAGRIEVNAGDTLLMEAGASLLATASGGFAGGEAAAPTFSDGRAGGLVALFAPVGNLQIDGGTIDVQGTRVDGDGTLVPEASGRVQLMAARTSASTIAATPVAATITGARSIEVFGHSRYTGAQGATLSTDAAAFSANAATVRNALGLAGDARVRVAPSAELRITGNANSTALGIVQATLFNATNIAPGLLAVRSTGDLTLGADIVDGTIRDRFNRNIADSAFSWAYSFTAGADLDAVDFSAVSGDTGNLVFGAGVDLVTGTGDIVLNAGGDVLFGEGATVQSIGRHLDGVNFRGTISDQFTGTDAIQQTAVRRFLQGTSFPEAGGDIRIAARGDYVATRPTQQLSQWTFRIGGSNIGGAEQNAPDAWGLVLDSYRGNVGMFGGGDVAIRVGGDLIGAQVSNASFGRQEGVNSYNRATRLWTVTSNVVNELGGGRVDLEAGGSILGLDLHVGRGEAFVQAGGAIADRTVGAGTESARLFLGNARTVLEAGSGISIGNVLDPNTLLLAGAPAANPQPGTRFETFYLTYTPHTTLDLFSAAGDIVFRNRSPGGANLGVLAEPFANFLPGNLGAYAAAGDILVDNVMYLMPNARGTLRLVAAGSVDTLSGGGSGAQVFQMDTDPALLPRLGNAFAHPTSSSAQNPDTQALLNRFLIERDGRNRRVYDHATLPVNTGDPQANEIVARDGDISTIEFILSKRAGFVAGRDLVDLSVTVQNIGQDDFSLFSAGRDLVMNTPRVVDVGRIQTNSGIGISVAGPGAAHFLAGRDIDLGTSDGIRSIGDFANPGLADSGARLTLFAGLGSAPDVEGFAAEYLLQPAYAALFDASVPVSADNPAGPVATRFARLSEAARRQFALRMFFAELQASGVAAADPLSTSFDDYSRGFTAAQRLFPGRYEGSVSTALSTVQTQDGGSIDLLVPGGSIDAGLSSTVGLTADAEFKSATDLGYIVFRTGTFNAFVRDNFNVNSTRVFAQQGGDVLIWSSAGDIDAGRGAKSAASIPLVEPVFDERGNFVSEPPLAVSGSGIRNFAPPGTPPGTLFLFAPQGVINAGDAGIGSAGNIVLGATDVIGADNIDVGGLAVGVPTTDTGSIAAGLTGVGDVAASATKATEKATAAAAAAEAAAAADSANQSQMSIISVKVLGFGA